MAFESFDVTSPRGSWSSYLLVKLAESLQRLHGQSATYALAALDLHLLCTAIRSEQLAANFIDDLACTLFAGEGQRLREQMESDLLSRFRKNQLLEAPQGLLRLLAVKTDALTAIERQQLARTCARGGPCAAAALELLRADGEAS